MPELRSIGKSGLSTPALVLGGNVFGWTSQPPEAFDILDEFIAAGGTMIDTADVYSAWLPGHKGGESETVIGQWLKKRGRRDDVLIATKVGMLPGEGGEGLKPERIAAAVEASLNRLQTDYIDLYYAHRDDPATPINDVLRAFADLVAEGKVRTLGASNFSAERLRASLTLSAERKWPAYSVLQPELNVLQREGFPNDMRLLCAEQKIGVLPYFGLASGFLTGKYRRKEDLEGRARRTRVEGYLNKKGLTALGVMDAIAKETGASLAQIALAWCAAQPGVTAPIASASSVTQLRELMGALTLSLSADQLRRLDEVSMNESV